MTGGRNIHYHDPRGGLLREHPRVYRRPVNLVAH
jgi:hypothetical protein